MATQKSVKWSTFDIRLGDGATPIEAFTAPCALRTRGLQFTAETTEVALLDCTTPDQASWMKRNTISNSGTMTGSGTLDPDDLSLWWTWFTSAVEKNVRMYVDIPAGDGGGYWEGPFLLTSLNNTGGRDDGGGVVQIEVEMMSAGEVTWVAAT